MVDWGYSPTEKVSLLGVNDGIGILVRKGAEASTRLGKAVIRWLNPREGKIEVNGISYAVENGATNARLAEGEHQEALAAWENSNANYSHFRKGPTFEAIKYRQKELARTTDASRKPVLEREIRLLEEILDTKAELRLAEQAKKNDPTGYIAAQKVHRAAMQAWDRSQ